MPVTADQLRRRLSRLTRESEALARARAALPPGSSRARVTTANARWARKAEERERVRRELDAMEDDAHA